MVNLQEAEDLFNTVRVSARRFEDSPFLERQDTTEMIRGVYADRFFAIYNGEDPIKKYWTLRRNALLFDVPEKPIEITGRDSVAFLEKVFTRKVKDMKIGRGYYAIACTPQGGIFMDGVMFRFDETKFWYVQADGALETWLIAHSENFDVKISDPNSRVLQIQGPASMEIMNLLSGGEIDEGIKYFQSGFFRLGGQNLYVSRTGFTGELGYEIYCDGGKTDHLSLWDNIMDAGKGFGMELGSTSAMNMRRIEAGILGNTTDMDINMTPYDVGFSQFVDLDKENFVGRAALAQIKEKKISLLGATCKTRIPRGGSEILDENQVVGKIRTGFPSPTLGVGIGYAQFFESEDWLGKNLELRFLDGESHRIEIVDLPFFDKKKEIVRGVDRKIPEINTDILALTEKA